MAKKTGRGRPSLPEGERVRRVAYLFLRPSEEEELREMLKLDGDASVSPFVSKLVRDWISSHRVTGSIPG